MCTTRKQTVIVNNGKPYTVIDADNYTLTKIVITLVQQLREAKDLKFRIERTVNTTALPVYKSFDLISVQNAVDCLQAAIDNLKKISKV